MLGPDLLPSRFHDSPSAWVRSFKISDLKILVVCRGPVRLEAFQVFDEIGVREYGMLLSEKDSIVYPRCLAPELRSLRWPDNVHRIPDYMGAGQTERIERIGDIVRIAKTNGYTHVFAGYGFMAEEADFIQALEDADIGFLGPSASVIRRAGAKDEAKKLARSLGNAVIPGIDDVSARALLDRVLDQPGLVKLASQHKLEWSWDESTDLAGNAESLLQEGYANNIELVTIEALQRAATVESEKIWSAYPDKRIRFKCIGGGGGKGQRVVSDVSEIDGAVMEILAEQKVTQPGSNRNFLIELNLETTRHNEIQVIGNGQWALALGGRDCSLQMREQKQLEFSLTTELLDEAIPRYEGVARETLTKDKVTLKAMEDDSEAFGMGVGLNSVSTFECIVEGFDHFFMEMNTRIQVEHAVSELAYRIKFTNPDDSGDYFYVERLIEAMVLIALHGSRLPRPERALRHVSGAEIRVNATNSALQPHAGGLIRNWSDPLPHEVRDDQGIGIRNPDTGSFIYYNLAGAYDSNIALLLSHGESRAHNLARLAEIVRKTELRGDDLETSLTVQRGLINWTLGVEPMMKPNTNFLIGYLAAVGSLQQVASEVDLDVAFEIVEARSYSSEERTLLGHKRNLILRPLARLIADPHALAGFIGLHQGRHWKLSVDDSSGNQPIEVDFLRNPVHLLNDLYQYLNMDSAPDKPISDTIWREDEDLLQSSLDFYAKISERTGSSSWNESRAILENDQPPSFASSDPDFWNRCQAAHRRAQLGLDLLKMLPRIAREADFDSITVNEQLEPILPAQFRDNTTGAVYIRALAPPPLQSAHEIVTPLGGTFYARESPDLPALIEEGDHFEAGQPLFIIEVMKMFNKVLAPFAGTVKKCIHANSEGVIVSKGERIFEIEPDEIVVHEDPETVRQRRSERTRSLVAASDGAGLDR